MSTKTIFSTTVFLCLCLVTIFDLTIGFNKAITTKVMLQAKLMDSKKKLAWQRKMKNRYPLTCVEMII